MKRKSTICLHAVEGELLSRRYGDCVRLEVADNCSQEMEEFLLSTFRLGQEDLYRDNGPVNLNRLLAISDLVDMPELKFPPFSPRRPKGLASDQNIFEAIRAGDILLHHPFDSFLAGDRSSQAGGTGSPGAGDQADALSNRAGFGNC